MKQLITVLIGVTVCVAPSMAGAQVSWPMYQGNAAHTGYVPVSFDPSDFTLDWEITLSPGGMDVQQVAAVDGLVFVTLGETGRAVNDDLFALDASTGEILWSKNYVDAYSVSPPAYDDSLVYVQVTDGMQDAHLYIYSSIGGTLIDDMPFTSRTARYLAPAIVNGTAYIAGGFSGGMYAFNFLAEPKQRWFKKVHDYDAWTPAVDGIFAYAYTGPVFGLMGQLTVVRCSNGVEVYSITDSEHYAHELPWHQYLAPVLGGQDDALVIQRGELISFDLDNRDIRYEIGGGFGYASPTDGTFSEFDIPAEQPSVAKGVVYAVKDRNLEALNQSDGSQIWSWVPMDTGNFWDWPRVTNNIVITDTHAFVVVPIRTPAKNDPGLTSIHAINLNTGLSDWSHDFAYTYGDIAWSEGRLYFAREDGILSALKLGNPYDQSSVVQLATTEFSVPEDAGSATVTLRRTGSADGTVGVTVTTEDGTAMVGSDYAAVNQAVSWTDGDTADKTVQVTIHNDSATEGVEYLNLKLHSPTGEATLGAPSRGQLTIYDDETDVLRFTAAGTDIAEAGGTVSVSVMRDGPATGPVSVAFATANGSASAGSDYTANIGTLEWPDGDTANKNITLSVLDDGAEEDDETFTVSLSAPTGNAVIGSPGVILVTVVDDDGPRLKFSAASYQAEETGGTLDLAVNRTGNTDGEISVDWATGGGSATPGQDYLADSGTLNWASGDGADKTITLTVNDDGDTEGGESFQVTLSNPVGVVELGEPAVTTVSIVDDEALESPINTTVDFGQTRPRVAMDATGGSVIVWDSWRQDGWGWGVYGQRFDAAGDPVGSEFQVNTTTDEDQMNPAVARSGGGSFMVVWQADVTAGTGVYGRLFNPSGTPLGGEFAINTSTSGSQTVPRVACDGNGRFMVVWQGRDGSGAGVFARVFDSAGNQIADEFGVNTTTPLSQNSPDVAGSAEGGFVVVWESYAQDDGLSDAVIGRRFASNGAAQGGEFAVNVSIAGDQTLPAVTASGSGKFLVVWQDDNGLDGSFGSVRGRWFDAAATPIGVAFQINNYSAGDQGRPVAAAEPAGRAVVVWESRNGQDGSEVGVFGRVLYDDGTFASDEFLLNTHILQTQNLPAVACSSAENYAVAWSSENQDGSAEGVYGVVWPLPPVQLIFADGFESGDIEAW